ncbi:hypothetical protein PENTCL1PPCAC_784 [Pristionchus entomophagus]|uniref:Golgin-84 n=1 Tax=Pristionchus entomophagus TaxID=358040 RepID=A0AAV5SEZ8_9BILA|nr:hypothetical protein PENTCL1PPCAC_784 [Pristionchus entomophagus]
MAAPAVRPSKRDVIVIDDDESDNDQPAVKSSKIEEEAVPSPEIVDLRQKLNQSEDNLQNHATKEAELRAERAEKLLDSKQGVKDKKETELEEKPTERSLEEARRGADSVVIENLELTEQIEALKNEMADMKKEHEEKLAEVSSRLERAKKRAENAFSAKVEYSREKDALKMELAELKRSTGKTNSDMQLKVTNLTTLLDQERTRASDSQKRDQARIDDLTEKLVRYERGPLPVDIDHPTNIFQLCSPDSDESMSYELAREKLFSVAMELDGESLDDKLNLRFARSPKLHSLILLCPPCGAIHNMIGIIGHFLSKAHRQMVSAQNAAVSRAAFNFWLSKLQPESAAQHVQYGPAVDAATSTIPVIDLTDESPTPSEVRDETEEVDG